MRSIGSIVVLIGLLAFNLNLCCHGMKEGQSPSFTRGTSFCPVMNNCPHHGRGVSVVNKRSCGPVLKCGCKDMFKVLESYPPPVGLSKAGLIPFYHTFGPVYERALFWATFHPDPPHMPPRA